MINRGLAAATALSNRKVGDLGATATQIEESKLYSAAFAQRLGKVAEAAKVYLDYAEDPLNKGKTYAAECMDQARDLISNLYRQNPKDAATEQMYDRMLKVGANPPYNREDLFYYYAYRLMTKAQDLQQAIDFFAKVKKGDKKEFDARYWQMQAGEQLLATTKDVTKKVQEVRVLLDLCTQVRVLAQQALANNPDAATAQKAKFRIANATLLEADLALQQAPPQPKRTLQVLQGFEQQIAGLPQAEPLGAQATLFRARALLADGQLEEAIKLIEKIAGDPKTVDFATNLVRDVLKQVDAEYRAAKEKGDRKGMAGPAKLKAQLADVLGKVVKKEADPEKQADNNLELLSFAAAAKFEAADLQDVPAEKQKLYQDALAAYAKLTPAIASSIERYTKRLAEKPNDDATTKKLDFVRGLDVRVTFNIAKCNHELGNYNESIVGFGTLLAQGKLGTAKIFKKDSKGEMTIEDDNDDYWEAVYSSNLGRYKVYEKNPNDPAGQNLLRAARATVLPIFSVSSNVGGARYAQKMQELRKLLDPTGTAGAATQPTTPQTQPATAPTAQAK